jgi:hypothetical protein
LSSTGARLKTLIVEEMMQLRLEFGKQAERVLIRNGDN